VLVGRHFDEALPATYPVRTSEVVAVAAAVSGVRGRALLDRQRWRARLELANAVFDYLEIFHNRRRRHSALGWLTPIEFENRTSITVA
jgi:transposase InsO family protein